MVVKLAVLVVLMLTLQDTAPAVGDVNVFLTAGVGFLSSLLLGGAKGILGKVAAAVGVADTKITAVIKPAQPLVLLGLAWALPKLAAATGIVTPDAAALVNAPLATVLGVTAREGVRRLFPKPTA